MIHRHPWQWHKSPLNGRLEVDSMGGGDERIHKLMFRPQAPWAWGFHAFSATIHRRLGLGFTLWILLGSLAWAEAASASEQQAGKTTTQPNTTTEDASDPIAEILNRGKDPFGFGYAQGSADGADEGALIPMNLTELSTSIQLKGVFIFDKEAPSALVQVGGTEARFVVRVGDLVPIPVQPNTRPASRQNRRDQQYLLVKAITESAVTVALKKRPEELITIR